MWRRLGWGLAVILIAGGLTLANTAFPRAQGWRLATAALMFAAGWLLVVALTRDW